MSDKSPNSSEEEYFYLNIASYLGLSLSKDEAQNFQKIGISMFVKLVRKVLNVSLH